MSSTIKRWNHRIHPCSQQYKNELIYFLIERNAGKTILIATSENREGLPALFAGENITVLSDAELAAKPDLRCEVLISYDLPEKAIVYMSRFARASEYALITLDAEDQKRLYPIELLNGRTIIQEVINGFKPDFGIAVDNQQKAEAKARRAEREARDALDPRNRDKKPIRDTRPSHNKKDQFESKKQHKSKSRFVGKDETGKPIFEGKTRERNHYIDGTPKTEEEKRNRTKFGSKPKFFGDKEKKSDDRKSKGQQKSYGEKKPFDKDKKSYTEKKPFGEKKTYGDRPSQDKKGYSDKKTFADKKAYRYRKPTEAPAAPKRTPRRIDVKSLKPKKEGE